MEYPLWLKEFFSMMALAYGIAWKNQYGENGLIEPAKKMWFDMLKNFHPDVIRIATMEAIKHHPYPPRVAEMLDVLKAISRQQKFDKPQLTQDKKREKTLPSPLLADYMRLHPESQFEAKGYAAIANIREKLCKTLKNS